MEVLPEENSIHPLANSQAISRAHLESMTTSDLIKMADNLGIDIPPDLDRIFIIEELLEIAAPEEVAEDITIVPEAPDTSAPVSPAPVVPPGTTAETHPGSDRKSASVLPEGEMADSGLVESVPLPRHYNITFIEVMIRDPLWAFVFWEIKAQDKDHFEKAQDFEGYHLKVSPWVVPTLAPTVKPVAPAVKETETEGVFTVPVTPNDTAWYLGLNPTVEQGKLRLAQIQNEPKQYKVELCACMRGGETVIAVSNPFKLPLLHELPTGKENSLVRLSGYGDFHILRNNERMFRTKRSSGTYE